jgi:hypothetical protein
MIGVHFAQITKCHGSAKEAIFSCVVPSLNIGACDTSQKLAKAKKRNRRALRSDSPGEKAGQLNTYTATESGM